METVQLMPIVFMTVEVKYRKLSISTSCWLRRLLLFVKGGEIKGAGKF
jgi:hypothetical protein